MAPMTVVAGVVTTMFALGRERVLPAALGRTESRTGAPRTASLGLGYGVWLRSARPEVDRGIGLGADAGG
jgi:amino acid transporter